MSRNMALEKVGRARVAYMLQQKGWRVGEAFDDGFDLLAVHPKVGKVCLIEVKAMDANNRSGNFTAPLTPTERKTCTHVVVYVEPQGLVFVARKKRILTKGGNIFAPVDRTGVLRKPKKGSKSFVPYLDKWDELFR